MIKELCTDIKRVLTTHKTGESVKNVKFDLRKYDFFKKFFFLERRKLNE